MSYSVYPAPSTGITQSDLLTVPNWTYVGAFTLGSSSTTYSGISGYKKLRVLGVGLEHSGATGQQDLRMTINGSSNSVDYFYYTSANGAYTSVNTYDSSQAYINLSSLLPGSGYSQGFREMNTFDFEIDNANNTNHIKPWKMIKRGQAYTASEIGLDYSGIFRTSGQTISSITFTLSSFNISSVSAPRGIFLYGAN